MSENTTLLLEFLTLHDGFVADFDKAEMLNQKMKEWILYMKELKALNTTLVQHIKGMSRRPDDTYEASDFPAIWTI